MKDTETIHFECPNCAKRLRVAATAAGKRFRCPKCRKPVAVPEVPDFTEAPEVIDLFGEESSRHGSLAGVTTKQAPEDGNHEPPRQSRHTPTVADVRKWEERHPVATIAIPIVFLIAGVTVIGYSLSLSSSSDSHPKREGYQQRATPTKKWYQGGTLQNATMKEWNQASRANKLATSVDFIKAILEVEGVDSSKMDMDKHVRPAAERMVHDLDDAYDEGGVDNVRASEVAFLVWAIRTRGLGDQ